MKIKLLDETGEQVSTEVLMIPAQENIPNIVIWQGRVFAYAKYTETDMEGTYYYNEVHSTYFADEVVGDVQP